VLIFHAGTTPADRKVATAGGRVLSVAAVHDSLEGAGKLACDGYASMTCTIDDEGQVLEFLKGSSRFDIEFEELEDWSVVMRARMVLLRIVVPGIYAS
jgi:hypothetical protein